MTLKIEELDAKRHNRAAFDCGVQALNRYLAALAAQHRIKGIATSFVLVDSETPADIFGYHNLSAASLSLERMSDSDRKGLPAYPIPAVRIGRLATAIAVRGRGYGELLLQNAIKRILQARSVIGVHVALVDAKDAGAAAFYRKYGFRPCEAHGRQLHLPLGAG